MFKKFIKRAAKRFLPLEKVNLVLTTRICGKKVRLPMIRRLRVTVTEPWLLDLLAKILDQRKGAFLDVGANLGQTLIKVKCLDPQRRYVGFEPNPACCFYLKELIEQNRFKNCMIVPVGLMNRDGLERMDFFSSNCADTMASLIEGFRSNRPIHHSTLVPVFRFDSISSVCGIDDVGFIKIDVEGAEAEVLETLRHQVDMNRPVVILEILPVCSNTVRRERNIRLQRLLRGLNYVILGVKTTGRNAYGGLQEIETNGIYSDPTYRDYLAIPDELKEIFCSEGLLGTSGKR